MFRVMTHFVLVLCISLNLVSMNLGWAGTPQPERTTLIPYVLDDVVGRYGQIKKPEDLANEFFVSQPKADQELVIQALKKWPGLPRLTRNGDVLTFTFNGGQTVTLEILSARDGSVKVNGTPFKFDPNKTILSEIERLDTTILHRRSASHPVFDLLFPRAEAVLFMIPAWLAIGSWGSLAVGLTMAGVLGSFFAMPMVTKAVNALCPIYQSRGVVDNYPFCSDWKKEHADDKQKEKEANKCKSTDGKMLVYEFQSGPGETVRWTGMLNGTDITRIQETRIFSNGRVQAGYEYRLKENDLEQIRISTNLFLTRKTATHQVEKDMWSAGVELAAAMRAALAYCKDGSVGGLFDTAVTNYGTIESKLRQQRLAAAAASTAVRNSEQRSTAQ